MPVVMRNMATIKAKAQADSSPVKSPERDAESPERRARAKEKWKKAKAAKAGLKLASKGAQHEKAENTRENNALPLLQGTREGAAAAGAPDASARASLERVQASKSAMQKEALERMLSNAGETPGNRGLSAIF